MARLPALSLTLVIAMAAAHAQVAEHPTQITDAELFAALDLSRLGLEPVRAAVEAEDWTAAAEAWAEYFRARETPTPHFRRDTWPQWLRETHPQVVAPIIAEADELVAGRISHGPYVLRVEGRELQWLDNPTTDTNYVCAVGSQEFLNPLGRAYLLTGDERYARTFAWIFDSWYDHQDAIRAGQGGLGFDPMYRAYYPGVRARILADNYYCLARSEALTPALHLKLMKALLGACAWLSAQNAPRYSRGNQQVAAVVGLGVVGQVFPEFRDAQAWVELAEMRMREHLRDDFFADGGHKELCTQYHKTVLRDVGYVALTAEANGREGLFSDPEAGPALERAYEWLARLVMPTGETPALHSAVFATDYAVHLELAARHFGRGDFAGLAGRFWDRGVAPNQKMPFAPDCYMLGEPAAGMTLPAPEPAPWLSLHLAASGFAVMRTGWAEGDRYLVAQYGWANTGHAYPGALHFIYEANGELVASAPGSPRSYRHPAYAYCHTTPAHNCVTIDGQSYPLVNGIAPGGACDFLADLPGAWLFAGAHEGYRGTTGAVIRREILAIKDGPVLVRDRIEGGAGHEAQWNFHSPLKMDADTSHARLTGRAQYTLRPAWPEQIESLTREERWAAVLPRDCQPEDCGREVSVLRWHKPIGEDGARFAVALFAGEMAGEAPAVQDGAMDFRPVPRTRGEGFPPADGTIEPLGEGAFRLTQGDRRWLILFGDEGRRVEGAGVAAIARCACVEYRSGEPARAWVFDGTRLTVDDRRWLATEAPVTREVAPKGASNI